MLWIAECDEFELHAIDAGGYFERIVADAKTSAEGTSFSNVRMLMNAAYKYVRLSHKNRASKQWLYLHRSPTVISSFHIVQCVSGMKRPLETGQIMLL